MLRSLTLVVPLLAPSAPASQSAPGLLVDLDTEVDIEADALGPGGNGQVEVLGTALGRLWLTGSIAGASSKMWSIESPGTPAELWTLDGLGSGKLLVDHIAELTPEKMLVSLRDVQNPSITGTYVTDGTSGNAVRLSELPFTEVLVENGVAFLVLERPQETRLLRTDGTLAGTELLDQFRTVVVGDLIPADLNGTDRSVFRVGGFLAYASVKLDSIELFAQPIAGGGRQLLGEFDRNMGVDLEFSAAEAGSRLLFTARPLGTSEHLLWATDGTVAGTSVLVDFQPGSGDGAPHILGSDGQRAVLSADSTGLGEELHITDGTVAGTQLVTALGSGGGDRPISAIPAGSGFVFGYTASTQSSAEGVYFTDGTASGTVRLTSPAFDFGSGSGLGLVTLPGGAGFFENGTASMRRLWFTDTTAAGSFPLTGGGLSSTGSPVGFAGEFWFGANQGDLGRELYRASPSPFSATLGENLGQKPLTYSSLSSQLFRDSGDIVAGPGRAWFHIKMDGAQRLVVTDGTPGGTSATGAFRKIGNLGTPFRNGLFFAALPPTPPPTSLYTSLNYEPWFSDGTPGGTVFLGELKPGPTGSLSGAAVQCAVLGDRIVFATKNTPNFGNTTIWTTDGTPAGTQDFAKLPLGQGQTSSVIGMQRAGDRVYFGLEIDSIKLGLWSTDGTKDGTTPVEGVPGPFDEIRELTADRGRLYFTTQIGGSREPWTVWTTDGRPGGTFEVGIFRASAGWDTVLRRLGKRMVVLGQNRIAVADLENRTTQEVFNPGLEGYIITRPSSGEGDLAYFRLLPTDEANGALDPGLWVTDGTVSGTRFVSEVVTSAQVLGSDGRALFVNSDAATGPEPWMTDGTPEGTRLLGDVLPGPLGSMSASTDAANGIRVGNSVIYRGYDMVAGLEPHVLSVTGSGSYISEPFGFGCADCTLDVAGELRIGATVHLEVDAAAPLSTTRLYVSTTPAEVQLGACTLYLESPAPLLDLTADAQGTASLPFDIPAEPALVGVAFYLQGANLVPGGGFAGVADLTNAVELVFGQ